MIVQAVTCRDAIQFSITSIAALLCISCCAYTQQDVEMLSEVTLDAISIFQNDPICLYTTTPNKLALIPGIAQRTASRILAVVSQHGRNSWAELEQCLSTDQWLMLRMCTTLDCDSVPDARPRLTARYRLRNADASSVAARSRLTWGNLDGGWTQSTTADSSINTVFLTGRIGTTRIAAGNHTLHAAQGLVFGNSTLNSKQRVEVINDIDCNVRPWTSSYLEPAFYGAAVQTRLEDYTATMSYGNSIKNARREASTGISVGYGDRSVSLGLNVLHLSYDSPSSSSAANNVKGTDAWIAGTAASRTYDNTDILAEVAATQDGVFATVISVSGHDLPQNIIGARRYGITAAYYPASFINPYASSIAPWTDPTNAFTVLASISGLYHGFKWHATIQPSFRLSKSYGSILPATRTDVAFSVEKNIATGLTTDIQVLSRWYDDQVSYEKIPYRSMEEASRWSVRIDLEATPSKSFITRFRVHLLRKDESTGNVSDGVCGLLDMTYTLYDDITFRSRYCVFSSDNLDTAPYVAETDAIGSMRIVPLTGTGKRLHTSIRFRSQSSLLPSLSLFMAHDIRTAHTFGLQLDYHLQF